MANVEKIKKLKTSGATSRKRKLAIDGRVYLSPLDESKFFVVYLKLSEIRDEIDDEINYLVHNTEKYMKRSVTAYFKSKFNNRKVELVKKPKKQGIQVIFLFLNYSNTLFLARFFCLRER
jgi:hypothetical protein